MYQLQAQNTNVGDSIIGWFEGSVPGIISNAGNLFNYAIVVVVIILALLWINCGIIMLRDSLKRFDFQYSIAYFLILIVGVIGGPIALVAYNIVKPQHSVDELDFMNVEHKFYYHQASKVVDCLNCQAYVLEGHTYCTNCGTQNRFKCEKCGTLTDYDDIFCYNCGANFGKRYEEIVNRLKFKNIPVKTTKASKEVKTKSKVSNERKNVDWQKIGNNVYSKVKVHSKTALHHTREITKKVHAKAKEFSKTVNSKIKSK